MVEWNDTARDVPGLTLAELFESQVARTPEAPAVVFGDESLSFAEVDERANRLAHVLIDTSVGYGLRDADGWQRGHSARTGARRPVTAAARRD